MAIFRPTFAFVLLAIVGVATSVIGAEKAPVKTSVVSPGDQVPKVLAKYCFDCHGDGSKEGGIAIDRLLDSTDRQAHHAQWLAVWKNLRAQTMPPAEEKQPSDRDRSAVIHWIQREVFKLDPASPDPGRVTVRRLNRTEYAYTMHDLLGVDFDVDDAFPADDTGYGFDTIGDVLSVSPLLMEKYVEAAEAIVAKAIPPEGPQPPKQSIGPEQFRISSKDRTNATKLSFDKAAKVQKSIHVEHAGRYRVRFDLRALGSDEATSNTAEITIAVDDKPIKDRELGWDANNTSRLEGEVKLSAGEHTMSLSLKPVDPPLQDENHLYLNVRKVEMQGPMDGKVREYPKEFQRVFFEGAPPADKQKRRDYAARILKHFADRAFRRPIDQPTLDRLTAIALDSDPTGKSTFEQAIARGLTAVLVSPRFLFRAEVQPEPDSPGRVVPLDEFALASRMSYFLWSSLPDDELLELAKKKQLRANLTKQIDRMIDDPRSERFVENFVGQWLLTRDVEGFNVDAKKILRLKSTDEGNRIFNRNVRRAMKDETESMFAHLLKNHGSALDLLTADYTFLNETLAKFYGIHGVEGSEMRKVNLSKADHRGGILTHGSVALVTSNPTITSPVKRGLFVLENLLGTPPPPPPPDVPPLESAKGSSRRHTLRELMEAHRAKPLCASCHARMDPIGLAMEEYNVFGQWRDDDLGRRLDTAGQLITGEKFANTLELEKVIATSRRADFYRCLTEKLLTFAVGRGIEYYDAPAIDTLTEALEHNGGDLRKLVHGVIESAPFQKRRGDGHAADHPPSTPTTAKSSKP
jgi:mono/diheme cytochrome c family protein